MGIPGPAPKYQRSRERDSAEFLMLPAEGYQGEFPPLPQTYRAGDEDTRFLKVTRAWYETWARSPQATQFEITDWQRLLMLARLVDAYHRDPTAAKLAEIRREESHFGATEDDRRKKRWRIAHDAPGDAADDDDDQDEAEDAPWPPRPSRRDPRLGVIDGGG